MADSNISKFTTLTNVATHQSAIKHLTNHTPRCLISSTKSEQVQLKTKLKEVVKQAKTNLILCPPVKAFTAEDWEYLEQNDD
jgi:hypothetical protein